MREFDDVTAKEDFVNLLRRMFKDASGNVFAAVYMTGFADLVFIPRKNVESPALVIELKFNKDADSAIDQIKRKQYPIKIAQYLSNTSTGNNSQPTTLNSKLLLVGINYDRQTKMHTCRIEQA